MKHKKPRGWPQEYYDICIVDDEVGHGGKGITQCEDGKWEIQEIPRGQTLIGIYGYVYDDQIISHLGLKTAFIDQSGRRGKF